MRQYLSHGRLYYVSRETNETKNSGKPKISTDPRSLTPSVSGESGWAG